MKQGALATQSGPQKQCLAASCCCVTVVTILATTASCHDLEAHKKYMDAIRVVVAYGYISLIHPTATHFASLKKWERTVAAAVFARYLVVRPPIFVRVETKHGVESTRFNLVLSLDPVLGHTRAPSFGSADWREVLVRQLHFGQ